MQSFIADVPSPVYEPLSVDDMDIETEEDLLLGNDKKKYRNTCTFSFKIPKKTPYQSDSTAEATNVSVQDHNNDSPIDTNNSSHQNRDNVANNSSHRGRGRARGEHRGSFGGRGRGRGGIGRGGYRGNQYRGHQFRGHQFRGYHHRGQHYVQNYGGQGSGRFNLIQQFLEYIGGR